MSKNKKRIVYVGFTSLLLIGLVFVANRLFSYHELLQRSYTEEVEKNFESIHRYEEFLSEASEGRKTEEELLVASWKLQRIESDLLNQFDHLIESGLYEDQYNMGLDSVSDKLDAISKTLRDAASYQADHLPTEISGELKSESTYLSAIMSEIQYDDLKIHEIKILFQAFESEMSEPADWQYNENR